MRGQDCGDERQPIRRARDVPVAESAFPVPDATQTVGGGSGNAPLRAGKIDAERLYLFAFDDRQPSTGRQEEVAILGHVELAPEPG
jgi:hypothetical protein